MQLQYVLRDSSRSSSNKDRALVSKRDEARQSDRSTPSLSTSRMESMNDSENIGMLNVLECLNA